MVSAFNSRSNDPGSSPSRDHCIVLLGETYFSHRAASFHLGPVVQGMENVIPRIIAIQWISGRQAHHPGGSRIDD